MKHTTNCIIYDLCWKCFKKIINHKRGWKVQVSEGKAQQTATVSASSRQPAKAAMLLTLHNKVYDKSTAHGELLWRGKVATESKTLWVYQAVDMRCCKKHLWFPEAC